MKKVSSVVAALVLTTFAFAASAASNERLGPTPHKSGNSGNAVAVTCSNTIVQDCGFENGPFGGVWTDASSNFGTPVCDISSCGSGGSTNGSYDGSYWTWFGGIGGTTEEGSETQAINLPANSTATLTFWFLAPSCSGDSNDFVEVTIDGSQVWTANGADSACNIPDPYNQISVDITAYADGAAHTLQFHSITYGGGTATTNFFIDDVDVTTAPLAPTLPGYTPVPTLGHLAMLGLLLLLALFAAWRLRAARKAQ